MKKYKAVISVGLKPTIKDIKAITLKEAVSRIVDVENFECKPINTYAVEFEAENKSEAEKIVHKIADDVLSNSVIEEYRVQWETPYV